MRNAAKAYFNTQVNTVSQGELVVMLYDAAIKFLKQSKDKIDAKDYAAKGILISKALDILSELKSTLNQEKGGEIAENLYKLYFYCSSQLLLANMNMDVSKIDTVISILDSLRSAFHEISQTWRPGAEAPAQAANTAAPSEIAPAAPVAAAMASPSPADYSPMNAAAPIPAKSRLLKAYAAA